MAGAPAAKGQVGLFSLVLRHRALFRPSCREMAAREQKLRQLDQEVAALESERFALDESNRQML